MAQMFAEALQRMLSGRNGQVVPVVNTKQRGETDAAQETMGYELQWLETTSVDPSDTILCRYQVKDLKDVERINDAQKRKQSIEQTAKAQK